MLQAEGEDISVLSVRHEAGHKILVVPSSLSRLESDLIPDQDIDSVEFAPISSLSAIESYAFSMCCLLQSICIPASVADLEDSCFQPPDRGSSVLKSVTFECGSQLKSIGSDVFADCTELHSICLPASLEDIAGSAFSHSNFSQIQIESGNPHFRVDGDFIVKITPGLLIAYFGHAEAVAIPDAIRAIGPFAFLWNPTIRTVSFGRASQTAHIDEGAFQYCRALVLISIPSSVQQIGPGAFSDCAALAEVHFASPPILEYLRYGAFCECRSLRSFCLPSSVIIVEEKCFSSCDELPTLTFEAPSRLRELRSLPPRLTRSIEIPDSVWVLRAVLEVTQRVSARCIINFGEESELKELALSATGHGVFVSAFVRLPSRPLKALRRWREFDPDDGHWPIS
jgi:hypothetical protein